MTLNVDRTEHRYNQKYIVCPLCRFRLQDTRISGYRSRIQGSDPDSIKSADSGKTGIGFVKGTSLVFIQYAYYYNLFYKM